MYLQFFLGHINNSLMTLRSCIECLRENQKAQESGGGLKVYSFLAKRLNCVVDKLSTKKYTCHIFSSQPNKFCFLLDGTIS